MTVIGAPRCRQMKTGRVSMTGSSGDGLITSTACGQLTDRRLRGSPAGYTYDRYIAAG